MSVCGIIVVLDWRFSREFIHGLLIKDDFAA